MIRRLLVLLAATVLLAAACGDDTPSVSEGPDASVSSTTSSSTTTTTVAVVDIDAGVLTDDYPCGYLFALGSADQTLSLVVAWDGGSPPDLTSPVNLPSEEWSGELRVGAELFANWCDDVQEPDEPVPVVVERWQLIAGELVIEPPDFDPALGCGEVRAHLDGAVVESPVDAQLALGDLELVNLSFGCFAG